VRLHFAAVAAALLAAAALAAPAATTAASNAVPGTGTLTQPVTGSFTDGHGSLGTFVGQFTLQQVTVVDGQLQAVGTLTGTLTDSLGNVIGTVSQQITVPLTATGSCQILDLTLGPLDLNLLGLMVHLDQVHLNITAQPGPGNLLGNLLCAVAHLLDNNNANTLNAIANLINQLIARL
jgi:hypothetical protein